ncbi:MAG TPA: ROK family protein [Arthrobacter sp.]|nr:ROK family protein [Arthrobacter sp.]
MNEPELPAPVLEIGGTHVTAALVRQAAGTWTVVADSVVRRDLDAHAPAGALLDALAAAADSLGSGHNGRWGVALPGPFDYANGVARYEHVGKFDQLQGVDVRAGLAERLGGRLKTVTFLNDADAFGIGEVALGAAGRSRRAACVTLGTGVGSSFLADGIPVKTGTDVPPDGSCYLLEYRGRPLEDTVSRRAIRRAYAAAAGLDEHDAGTPDVRDIAEAGRAGDAVAAAVLEDAFAAVGAAAAPYLERFGAEVLIVGGSMAGSWDIVEPAIRKGLAAAAPGLGALPLRRAERSEEAGLVGAAYWAACELQR